MIMELGYEPGEHLLEIRFRNGKTYNYRLVPERIFREFLDSPSAGEFFIQNVRGKYPFDLVADSGASS